MKNIQIALQEQFDVMCQTGKLFKVEVSSLWKIYLESFSSKYNPVFRDPSSSVHNCNICHNFIKRYGNIVALDENLNLLTLFDKAALIEDEEYQPSMIALQQKLSNSAIVEVFVETLNELDKTNYEQTTKNQSVYKLGIAKNFKQYTFDESNAYPNKVDTSKIYEFNHFALQIPGRFIDQTGESIESIQAKYRDKKNVFARGMTEISLDTLHLVKDLILQNSLLNGTSYLDLLTEVIKLKEKFLTINKKESWFWIVTYSMSEGLAKFRNTLLGTLCVELTEGKELNKACLDWNKRADPVNYMKAQAPITEAQKREARKFVEENGYEGSFIRTFATISDIKASEILHLNSSTQLKAISVFDNIKTPSTQHKRSEFDNVKTLNIEQFMKDVLPTASAVEVYFENKHKNNLCVLTKSANDDSKNLFKYSNNYSKTFIGNLAGKSEIKDAVKSRGGNTDAPVRVSLFFPNTTQDYDLHAIGASHTYYGNVRKQNADSGMLDLDAQGVDGFQPSEKRVENITYTNVDQMSTSTKIEVNNYSRSGLTVKFDVEIEIDGILERYRLNQTTHMNTVTVGFLKKTLNGLVFEPSSNMELVQSETRTQEYWNISTNQFHKVNLVCLSPNYWGDNKVGNKFYLFMIEGCKTDTPIRSFHNEDLSTELLAHRKVMDVLAASTMIEPTSNQVAGLGFNSTVSDELLVKVKGSHQRMLKIKF